MQVSRQTTARERSQQTLLVAVLVGLGLVALTLLGYRWSRDDSLATLVESSGELERDTASRQQSWRTAQVGDRFANGDGARTSARALAYFRLINGARLRLQPASQVRFQAPGGQGSLKLQVDLGQVDVQSATGAVQVDSEFGELHLDPNSSIRLRRDADRLLVDVELGRLQIGDQPQAVGSGQAVALELGGIRLDLPPAEPSAPSVDAGPAVRPPEPVPSPDVPPADVPPPADLVVRAGDSFVVHDPNPPTAIGFELSGSCAARARVTSASQSAEAAGQPSLLFPVGQHRYEVRCLDRPQLVAAKGSFTVLADAGTRQLPTFAPTANVITDGRSYTVLYQFRLPDVTVSWGAAPPAASYTLEIDGRALQTRSPSHELEALSQGTHLVTFSAATTPPRRSRTTTIEVLLDRQAPAARVSAPAVGFAAANSVNVAGRALPGWSVSIAGEPIPLDANRNFSVQWPGNGVIPIAFAHPAHGRHYYLRRPRGALP
jgi:hypothetical protein